MQSTISKTFFVVHIFFYENQIANAYLFDFLALLSGFP